MYLLRRNFQKGCESREKTTDFDVPKWLLECQQQEQVTLVEVLYEYASSNSAEESKT